MPGPRGSMSRLLLRKSVEDCENDILERGGLRRSLGKWHLTALGVGATIGAGSTISKDAPPDALTVSRARQTSISGWKRPTKKESK